MKTIITIFLFIISVNLYAQQADWTMVGKEIGYEWYYKNSTIVRGDNPFVVAVGLPQIEKRDAAGELIKYVTINILFYNSNQGMRVRISNQIWYYPDDTFKKAGVPSRDVPISFYVLLNKLYDMIRK